MKKKKISRNVKRRLTFLGPILTIILFFCITSICSYAYNIYALKKEEKKLYEQLEALKVEEETLNDEIIKLKDHEYIAKYARENYLYTKSGEYVIKFDSSNIKQEIEPKEEAKNNFYVIGLIVLIFTAIVFLLKSHRKSLKLKESK